MTVQDSTRAPGRASLPPPPAPPPPPPPPVNGTGTAPRRLTQAEVESTAEEVAQTGQRTLWADDHDQRLDKLAEASVGLDTDSRVRLVNQLIEKDGGAMHSWLQGTRANALVESGRISSTERHALMEGVAGAYNRGQVSYAEVQTFLGVNTQFAPAIAKDTFQGARDLAGGSGAEFDAFRARYVQDSFALTAERSANGMGRWNMDSAFAVTLANDAGQASVVADAFNRLDATSQRAVAAEVGEASIGYRNSTGEVAGLADPLATLTQAVRSSTPASTEAGRQSLTHIAEGLLGTRQAELLNQATPLYREVAEGRAAQIAASPELQAQGLARVTEAQNNASQLLATLPANATPQQVWEVVNRNHAAVVAPTFTQYLELRGDGARALQGAALRNEIGLAMGLQPDRAPQTPAEQAAFDSGEFDYFGGDGARAIQAVEAQIASVGGADARVTALPVTVASEQLGLIQLPLYRVESADGRTQFVDYNPATGESRTYRDFEDWRSNNKLPPGQMTYAANGHLTAGADGKPQLVTENTPGTPDTFWENWGQPVLDGAALVGGVVLIGAAIVGSGGTALIIGGAAVGIYGAARGGEVLVDRGTHGQTLNPIDSAEARNAWLNVGASVVGLAAAGSSLRLASAAGRTGSGLDDAAQLARLANTARGANVAAQYADTAAIVDTGYSLAANWDRLTPQQRVSALAQMAFWSGGTAVAARQSGGVSNLYGVGDFSQAMASTNQWLRSQLPTGAEIKQVLGQLGDNFVPPPGQHVVDMVTPDGQPLKVLVEDTPMAMTGRSDGGTPPTALSRLPSQIESARLTRDPVSGLITQIDGKPYQDFVNGLVTQRADEYRALRQAGNDDFTNRRTGPVVSIVIDRSTGQIFEGTNTQITNTHQLDPVLQQRLQALETEAAQHGPYDYGGRGSGDFPHPSVPGTHAEVSAVNQAIAARRARGEDVTWDGLQRDLFYDNAFLDGSTTRTAPTCANCTPLLDGIPANVGHFDTFPPNR